MKVFMLMAGLTALLVVLGGALMGQQGMVVFFVLAAVMNFGMYWFSDKMVLKMYKAKIIDREAAPELYDMVDRLRQRAGLPMPTVAIAPSEQPNAFATGRNHEHAVVCCTAGILKLVNRDELEGVIDRAHTASPQAPKPPSSCTPQPPTPQAQQQSASYESSLLVPDLGAWRANAKKNRSTSRKVRSWRHFCLLKSIR
jgi:hypothetical protein